ncbi:MAG: cytochrome c oxidase subunit II [Acidobacteriota bacterium]
MKVDPYEKAWMVAAVVLLTVFVATVVVSATAQGLHPPSHVETIDPVTCRSDPRFAELGVFDLEDGSVEVVMLAQVWAFLPGEVHVPAGVPVVFRMTSPDVIHGVQVVGTNVNATVIPGYVTEVVTTFERPGEYLILCNEYCGTGHHVMSGKLIVEDEEAGS